MPEVPRPETERAAPLGEEGRRDQVRRFPKTAAVPFLAGSKKDVCMA